jgi:D-threo-aldose 1-dehydrogenase
MNATDAKPTRAFPTRPLGRSKVHVPSLGLGCAALGNLYRPVSDEEAQVTIHVALELGVGYFDTAPFYGFGLSEQRVGQGLAAAHGRPLLSTKVGRRLVPTRIDPGSSLRHGYASPMPFEPVFDYSYDAVMRSHEESLRRLRVDRVDILLAHDIGRLTHGEHDAERRAEFVGGGLKAMRELRESGQVSAIGLGVNEWQVCVELMDAADFDCFLLAGRYTLLDQSALSVLLPKCERRGVSIIAGGVFNSGILVNGSRNAAQSHYDYVAPSLEIVERVRQLESVCARFDAELPAAALQFPLSHPQVACVLVGCAHQQEIQQAVEWLSRPIEKDFWRALVEEGLVPASTPIPASVPA